MEFVNYRRDDYKSIWGFLKDLRKRNSLPLFLVKAFVIIPSLIRWKKVFGGFIRDNVHVSVNSYGNLNDFKKHPVLSDIYCTGSDQVWNSTLNQGILPEFFLEYAPTDKPRIAFSASFGKESLEEWEREKTKELLSKYKYITVRESSGVEICKRLGVENVRHILDPTLLQTKDFWLKFVGKKPFKEDYLLVYQLHKEPGMDTYLRELAERLNLKIVRVCYRYDEIRKLGESLLIPTVEGLLTAIYHSSWVVTDSFHVTAFSTNMNKKFISIVPNHQFGGRISSLLQLTGLNSLALHDFNDFSQLDYEVNWDNVNKVYEEERRKTSDFFYELLKECK